MVGRSPYSVELVRSFVHGHCPAYAAAAGYDPAAMITCLERVRSQGAVADSFRHHPSLDDRLSELRSGIRRFRLARRGQVLQQERFTEHVALQVDDAEGLE